MVLFLHFYALKKLSCNLLMVGTSHSRASVDIKATTKEHTDYVPQILTTHILSGCDSMSYLWGYGNAKIANTKLSEAPELKSLPPTSDVFQEHVKHTHFQAAIWCASLGRNPPTLDPLQYGWSLDQSSNMFLYHHMFLQHSWMFYR